MAVMSKKEWKRRRLRRKRMRKIAILGGLAVALILVLLLFVKIISWIFSGTDDGLVKKVGDIPVTQKLLTVSDRTRPGTALNNVKTIVIHYAGMPGTTAKDQRDYYERLREASNAKDALESMHFIVGPDGEIIQCIPINEAAYGSKSSNENGLSIEFCCIEADGSMSKDTYKSLVTLVGYLCDEFDLKASDVKRHYDLTGKDCPLFFVKNEESWKNFLDDVALAIKGKDFTTSNPVVKKSN
ncbi:MAG: N-acetylmuramoyl-L-alanine amidase [Lachnospiraceae bacterium]|nr:N-acetylmuramoyl-L-alanine amidase [Lachnospiraceae bacterium]